MACFVLRVQR